MYEIKFSPVAEKYFKKLKEKSLKNAYNKALKEIAENPYVGEQKKGYLHNPFNIDILAGVSSSLINLFLSMW